MTGTVVPRWPNAITAAGKPGQGRPIWSGFWRPLAQDAVAACAEVLLLDQSLRWAEGSGPPAEEYFRRFPALTADRPTRLDLVYGEIRAVGALGRPLDFPAYAARFPELHDDLRRQLEVADWLRPRPSAAGPGRGPSKPRFHRPRRSPPACRGPAPTA